MKRSLLTALALFAASTTAQAQDSNWCRNGLFPSEPPFELAEVTAPGRTFFYDDAGACPDGEGCRTRSYLIEGDKLLINRTFGPWTCAFYPGKGGGTAGWIETRRLRTLVTDKAPPLEAWIGQWAGSEDNPSIRFWQEYGKLHVVGEAFWPGRPERTDWPSIHIGEISGQVERKGNTGRYEDDMLCEIDFTLVGQFLVGASNRNCGGANVSFTAVYKRESD